MGFCQLPEKNDGCLNFFLIRDFWVHLPKIADFLSSHKNVEKVIYPGLKSHPQHELAKRQMRGFGGMISVELKGGLEFSRRFLEKVEIFSLAESLGGVEKLYFTCRHIALQIVH